MIIVAATPRPNQLLRNLHGHSISATDAARSWLGASAPRSVAALRIALLRS